MAVLGAGAPAGPLEASCQSSLPVTEPPNDFPGDYTACDDTSGISAFAWLQSDPLAVNSGLAPFVCEQADFYCIGGGAHGDGKVAVESDWTRPGFAGCPPNANTARVGLTIQGSDGGGLIVLLTPDRLGGPGYYLVGAQQYDPDTGDFAPLACGPGAGRPEILSVLPGAPGFVQVTVRFPAPVVVSDCDAGSWGEQISGACSPPLVANPARGPVYLRSGPCSTRVDLRRNLWTATGALPDVGGNATINAPAPAPGTCLYVGGTTRLEGIESGGITGFARIPGAPCADGDGDGVENCAGDCNDADPARAPNLAEICDFLDNDCDGRIDEGLDCPGTCRTPVPNGGVVRVTDAPGDSVSPSIAATGTGYGLLWSDARTGAYGVYFARLGLSGERLGPDIRLSPPGVFGAVLSGRQLVWNGTEFGAAWIDNRTGQSELYFARLSAAGAFLSGPVGVAPGSSVNGASLVAIPDGYAVAWAASYPLVGGNDLFFRKIDASGAASGSVHQITNQPVIERGPVLAWNGSNFLVVWMDDRLTPGSRTYAALLNADGARAGPDEQISTAPYTTDACTVVAAGDGFGVAWQEYLPAGNSEVFAARLDGQGHRMTEVQVSPPDIASASNPALLWTGAEFRIGWGSTLTSLDALGVAIGDPVVLPSLGFQALASTGEALATVWSDNRFGNFEISFGRVGCYCADTDGDGYGACEECDDSRLEVNPGALETCNAEDDNCNGLIDDNAAGLDVDADGVPGTCDNCATLANPDQSDRDADGEGDRCDLADGLIMMMARDATFIDWQQEAGVASFNLYRGVIPGLLDPDHDGAASHYGNCLAKGIALTTYGDVAVPSLGTAFIYIVTGVGPGGESGFGVASSGAPRPNDAPCP